MQVVLIPYFIILYWCTEYISHHHCNDHCSLVILVHQAKHTLQRTITKSNFNFSSVCAMSVKALTLCGLCPEFQLNLRTIQNYHPTVLDIQFKNHKNIRMHGFPYIRFPYILCHVCLEKTIHNYHSIQFKNHKNISMHFLPCVQVFNIPFPF